MYRLTYLRNTWRHMSQCRQVTPSHTSQCDQEPHYKYIWSRPPSGDNSARFGSILEHLFLFYFLLCVPSTPTLNLDPRPCPRCGPDYVKSKWLVVIVICISRLSLAGAVTPVGPHVRATSCWWSSHGLLIRPETNRVTTLSLYNKRKIGD